MFTYNSESGYYWFNAELAADRENEYSLVGLVSSPTTFTNSYINYASKSGFLTYTIQLMGLAVYNNIILDIQFPPCCYKKLLSSTTCTTIPRREHKPVGMGADLGLDDLIQVMPVSWIYRSGLIPKLAFLFIVQSSSLQLLGRGLKALLEYGGNVEQELCYSFQVSASMYVAVTTVRLKPTS